MCVIPNNICYLKISTLYQKGCFDFLLGEEPPNVILCYLVQDNMGFK